MVTTPAPTEMTDERAARAREYAVIRRRLFFGRTAFGLVALLVVLGTGLSRALRVVIEGWTTNQWFVVPLYVLVLGVAYGVLTAPLDYYGGFVLPHRYGLSHQSLGSWFLDQAKGTLIGAIIGLPLVELLSFGLRRLPDWWWLVGGIVYLAFTVVLSNLAPVLLMPLFNTFTPLPDGELKERMMHLIARVGTRVHGVYTMDFSRRTSAANAFVTGIGPTRRIVLGDTLVAHYTPAEIETIMAHELGHHVHGDIWWGIGIEAVTTLVALAVANAVIHAMLGPLGLRSVADVAALPLLVLVLSVCGFLTMPLTNGYSRARERSADAYALRLTGDGPAFASAMRKLASQNLAEPVPPRWVVWLFYSHPPTAERVQRAETV